MEDKKAFKAWCVTHDIKQKDIADLLGISVQAANLKINGKKPFSLRQVAAICEAYHISADLFISKELQLYN